MIPVSSPWAPAAGWSVTASMPLISARSASSSNRSSSVPWAIGVGRHRVEVREPGQARGPLVELRVVLHRARAERVEPRVDRVVELAQVDVVAHDLGLGELGQRGGLRPQGRRGDPGQGIRRRVRDLAAAAPRAAALEQRRLEALADDAHRAPPATHGRRRRARRAARPRTARCRRASSPRSRTRAARRRGSGCRGSGRPSGCRRGRPARAAGRGPPARPGPAPRTR